MALGSPNDFRTINTGTLGDGAILKSLPRLNAVTGKSDPLEGIKIKNSDFSGPIRKLGNIIGDLFDEKVNAPGVAPTNTADSARRILEAGDNAVRASSVASGVGTQANRSA